MKENMQIIHVHCPQRDGDKFSMIATVGYEDKVELVLKRDFDKAIKLLKKVGRHHQGRQSIPGNLIRDYLKTTGL